MQTRSILIDDSFGEEAQDSLVVIGKSKIQCKILIAKDRATEQGTALGTAGQLVGR